MPTDVGGIWKLKRPLDFNTIAFMQMNRCMLLESEGNADFIHGVNGFEDLLITYQNSQYKDKVTAIMAWKDDKLWELKNQKTDDKTEMRRVEFEASRKKFQILMELAEICGLLPERKKDWRKETAKVMKLDTES